MGTSTHNKGQKGTTPLVPSWLCDPDVGASNGEENNGIGTLALENGDSKRFTGSRGAFTSYVNSGGRNGSSGRKSMSRYVRKSLGGSRNATQRMGASRQSAARLLNIAGAYASGGATAVEHFLSIPGLARKSAADAFLAIAEFVCPDGGTQDEGIARDAYINAIAETPILATVRFEDLNTQQMLLIVEATITNSILERITNDIGNKIISLPEDCGTAEILVQQVKEYVKGAVSDAMVNIGADISHLSHEQAVESADTIYRTAFTIMELWEESE